MKKIKLVLVLMIIIFVSLTMFAKNVIFESTWTDKPVFIDGKPNDWGGAKLFHNEKPAVAYSIKNDEKNLYIFFAFKEKEILSSVMKIGMTFWINTNGKEKKKYGINFRNLNVPVDKYISMLEMRNGPMAEAKKEQMKKMRFIPLNRNLLVGKGFKENTPAYGIKELKARFKMGWNQMRMPVFEFQIPLKREKNKIAGIGAEPGETVVLGISWGGWNKAMKKQAKIRNRKAMNRWRANNQNVGKRREDDQAYQPDLRPLKAPKKHIVWQKVLLAKK